MNQETLTIVTYISSYGTLVPFTIGIVKFRDLGTAQKLLLLLIFTSLLTEIVANILIRNGIENLIVYNIYALINFNLIFLIYRSHIQKLKNRIFLAFQVAFNLLAVLNAIFLQSPFLYNSNLLVSMSLAFLSLAFFYFYLLLKEVKYTRLEKNPIFWLNSGITIYYSGTIVLFILSNQIIAEAEGSYDLYLAAWGLNAVFNLILMTSYCITLWLKPTK